MSNRFEIDPRPQHGTAAFAVEFAQAAPARITAHDVRGRRVAVLHDGTLAAGRHELRWAAVDANGRRLPSGVYFLRIESPALNETHKLILIR